MHTLLMGGCLQHSNLLRLWLDLVNSKKARYWFGSIRFLGRGVFGLARRTRFCFDPIDHSHLLQKQRKFHLTSATKQLSTHLRYDPARGLFVSFRKVGADSSLESFNLIPILLQQSDETCCLSVG